MDFTAPDAFQKAVLDTTSSTTGNNLIPTIINPYIIELARKLSPVRELIPRKDWPDLIYTYKTRSATAPGQSYVEGATWNTYSNTYGTGQQTAKTIGLNGGVSNLLQAGSRAFADALQLEIDGITRGVVKYEEWLILNGNANSVPAQFNGIANQLATNTYYSSASSPAQISFNLLDAMDDDVKARGFGQDPASCFWICTPNMSTVIARLTQPYYRQDGQPMNLVGGFASSVYRNKRIIESSAAENVVAVTGETLATSGVSSTFKHGFVVRATFDDQVGNLANSGTPYPAPSVYVGGALANPSTYSLSVDPFAGTSVVLWTSAPSATVTANYFYKQQSIFLVDFSTMVMPVVGALQFKKLPDSINTDQQNFRIVAYESLAVMAEIGNALAVEVHG